MELHQLAYFIAVVEEASFTRAAARVNVAQPGVSAQIRKLEAELGTPLLNRGGRTVTPTAAGAAALPFARAALAGAAGVRDALAELIGLLRGQVTVGVVPSVGDRLADTLADFHAEHPAVAIRLVEDTSQALLEAVATGDLDLALAGLAGAPPKGLFTATVIDEEHVAAVSASHPLAARDRISLVELAEQALIALPRGTGGRDALERGLAAAGRRTVVAFEAGDPRVLMALAGRGLGVAVLPASAPEDLRVLRIDPPLRSRLELAWRADETAGPAARELTARARAALAPSSGPV